MQITFHDGFYGSQHFLRAPFSSLSDISSGTLSLLNFKIREGTLLWNMQPLCIQASFKTLVTRPLIVSVQPPTSAVSWKVGTMCLEKLLAPNRWSISVEKKKIKAMEKQFLQLRPIGQVISLGTVDRHVLFTLFTNSIFGIWEIRIHHSWSH